MTPEQEAETQAQIADLTRELKVAFEECKTGKLPLKDYTKILAETSQKIKQLNKQRYGFAMSQTPRFVCRGRVS